MRSTVRYWVSMGLILIVGCVLLIGRSAAAPLPSKAAAAPAAPTLEDFDEGDAPDETNNVGAPMTAYGAVPAKFPTVFTGAAPNGPSHMNIRTYFLGMGVTAETEADIGPDADGINNILPGSDTPDLDRFDDAFGTTMPNMSMFGHCQPAQLTYDVTVAALTSSGKAYVNLWIDWNQSGFWGGFGQCANGLANEWIVQNQIVPVTALGTVNYTTPPFLAWVPPGTVVRPSWLRITISDTPATTDDGRGPPNRWAFGETEDYLLPDKPPSDATPTPTKQGEPTSTPTPFVDPTHEPTWTPTQVVDPTKTPIVDVTNTPTPTKQGEPTWTPTQVVDPTRTPTNTPVVEPTKTPIVEPTWTPTKTPIIDPTRTPTNTPVVEPTKTPIIDPTKTPMPTATQQPQPDVISDLGDAPDTTNSTTSAMTTYISAVAAQFPTVFNATAPYGPFHHDIRLFNLGRKVTAEKQADVGFDSDGVNNIQPAGNIADQDRADDGLVSPRTMAGFQHCVPTKLTYTVTYNGPGTRQVFFNMWSDWNRNGKWGGFTQCSGGLSREWAVQNQVITLVPGLNTFTSPVFLPTHGPGRSAVWFRMTVSDAPAALDDGSGPAGGWKYGETEDYFLSPDLGDAPDSLNSLGVMMRAYSWPWWAWARFPTVYNRPFAAPKGPLHQNLGVPYVLGNKLTSEGEADLGPDDDTINNLVLGPRLSNQDRADDAFYAGVPTAASFKHCQPQSLPYRVTLPHSPPPSGSAVVYVNVWIDWNRNGAWGGVKKCIDPAGNVRVADEWAVKNQMLTLTGPAVYNLTTPNFIPYAALWPRPMWLRISISNTPATHADGRGPVGGWDFGETEDYLLKGHTIFADISGTVHKADGTPLMNSTVHLFGGSPDGAAGGGMVLVGTTRTDEQGNYRFDELPPGTYRLLAMHDGFHPQWFDHVHERDRATPVVLNDVSIDNVNFDLVQPTPPPVHVVTNGNVSYGPNGNFGVVLRRGQLNDVRLVTTPGCITCPNGLTPTNPRMVVRYPGDPTNQLTLPLTFDPATNTYSANLTVAMINGLLGPNHSVIEIYLVWECGNETIVKFVGRIEIIDPSGFITDIRTGQPIKGATVMLYQVPEWSARSGPADVDEDTCESNESRDGAWRQAAPQEMGVQADSNINLMSPTANTQVTGDDGYYGWNVGPGCWYVVVSAPGYSSRVSPVVGVPSAVTDLNIQLSQATSQLYMPMINR